MSLFCYANILKGSGKVRKIYSSIDKIEFTTSLLHYFRKSIDATIRKFKIN